MNAVLIVLLLDASGSVDVDWKSAALPMVETLGDGDKLAIVAFGSEASVVHPLAGASTGKQRAALLDGIAAIPSGDEHTDLEAGLAMALDVLDREGGTGATRAVILASDGRQDPAPGSRAAGDPLASLRGEILPAYVLGGVAIHTIAVGNADLALLREVASATGGRSIVAPDAASLGQALALVATAISGSPGVTQDGEDTAGAPLQSGGETAHEASGARGDKEGEEAFGDRMAISIAFALFVSLQIALIAMMAGMSRILKRQSPRLSRRRDRRKARARDESPLARMRISADESRSLLEEARTRFEALDLDIGDHGADLAESGRATEARYERLVTGVLLLVDHLEVLASGDASTPGNGEARWILGKARRVLGDAGIEEMDVSTGTAFDGHEHRVVSERAHAAPPGTVIEVARRGWRTAGAGPGEGAVLRPAEVVVSSGASPEDGGRDG